MTRQSVCLTVLAVAALVGSWRAHAAGVTVLAAPLLIVGLTAAVLAVAFTDWGRQ